MQHVFLTEENILSPRWLQAFPDAMILSYAQINEIPSGDNVLCWCVIDTPLPQPLALSLFTSTRNIVALSKLERAEEARVVIGAGAKGYLHYLATASLLQQVAEVVLAGGVWLGAELMRQMLGQANLPVVAQSARPVSLDALTPRERAVADSVSKGLTNKEIARTLDITERTVKAHLTTIFEKLRLRDRLQLALYVRQSLTTPA